LAQARGCDLPIEALFKAPIIVPVCPADLWHVGEQLKALTAWLRYGEVDDGGCD
jgi:hypothetical protein